MEHLVSIIIPCYNAEGYVRDAILSALAQTYPHKEVIVIDDGSTDRSLDIIKTFGDSVRHESWANRGPSAARNRGIQLARGTIIQFLDADDLIDSTKLERQVLLLSQDRNSLVFCDARVVDYATNTFLSTWGRSISCDDAVTYVLQSVLATETPLHWKQNLLRVGGWREDLIQGDDPDLHLRLACAGIHFKHDRQLLVTVRRVRTSLSHRDPVRGLAARQTSAIEAYKLLQRQGSITEERAKAFSGHIASIARQYLRSGLHEEARNSFEQARVIHASAGLERAYSPVGQWLHRIVGPYWVESLGIAKRRLLGQQTIH